MDGGKGNIPHLILKKILLYPIIFVYFYILWYLFSDKWKKSFTRFGLIYMSKF